MAAVEAELKRQDQTGSLVAWRLNNDGTDPVADAVARTTLEAIRTLLSGTLAASLVGDVALDATAMAKLEAIRALLAGTLTVGGSVSVTNFPASQAVTGPLTDAQLRATPVPVTFPADESGLTDAELRAADVKVTLDGEAVALDAATLTALENVNATVSGTVEVNNFPASQAVTGPLTDAELRATPVPVTFPVDESGLTDEELRAADVAVTLDGEAVALDAATLAALETVNVGNFPATQPVSGPLTNAELRAADVNIHTGLAHEVANSTAMTAGLFALPSTDVSNYRWVSIQLSGTWAGTLVFEVSNDNVGWFSAAYSNVVSGAGTPPVSSATSNTMVHGPVQGRYFRIRVSVGTSGTVTARALFYKVPGAITNTAGSAVTGPLTDAQLRASAVPVSGPVTDAQLRASALPVSGPLTDAQLRATPVPVSFPADEAGLTDEQLRAADVKVTLDGEVVALDAATLTALENVGVTGSVGILDSLGAAITPSNRLPVDVGGTINVENLTTTYESLDSTNNSTDTPLAANATFTGTWEDAKDYAAIAITVLTDQMSAINGAVVEFTDDIAVGTVMRAVATTLLGNTTTGGVHFSLAPQGRFFRLRYTNGTTAQTVFRTQTMLKFSPATVPIQPLGAVITDNNTAGVMRSHLTGRQATGQWTSLLTNSSGHLSTRVENDVVSPFARLLKFEPSVGEEIRRDETATDDYHGAAPDGTATSAASWRLARFYKDGAGNITRVRYRTGVVWDDRATGWT